MRLLANTLIAVLFLAFAVFSQNLPAPEREFRAAWIATVDNIDFPTKKTLTIEQQKAEIIRDLELAKSLNLNAVIFQVRPMCDAIYQSKIEPWSEFLTGKMGRAQDFDPLEFVIKEAHRRGILVHAWFNPYRAYHPAAKTVSDDHITKRRPDLVRDYGTYKWLDPSDPEVQKYSLDVVLDVVRRYDIDGVHFDDYFYPYPIMGLAGQPVDFPDDKNWNIYRQTAVKMSNSQMRRLPLGRDDWRRANVNQFIESVGREIKKEKPWIMYGISPFGVAEENYKKLYADAEKWLRDGTVDYFVPQLYWKSDRPNREFSKLLKFWENVNVKKRHVWAGIATYKIASQTENFSDDEIVRQIGMTRDIQTTRGNAQFSFKSIRNNLDGIQKALRAGPYKRAALIPASPWIKAEPIKSPAVKIERGGGFVRANWIEKGTVKAFWFVVYAKDKDGWSYSVLPATEKSISLSADREIEKIIVTSVDRLGNESPATI